MVAKVSTTFAAQLIEAMNKGSRDAVTVAGTEQSIADISGFIHTGCAPLDYYLTPNTGRGQFRGGLPIGRIIEIFGPEGSGKTTLATQALVSAQRGSATLVSWEKVGSAYSPKLVSETSPPGIAALVDSEVAFDKSRAQQLGLDVESLLCSNPKTVLSMEQELEWIEKLIESYGAKKGKGLGPLVIVWDSVAASQPKVVLESEFGDATVAARARLLQEAMRKFAPTLADVGATLICVNQVQDKIGGVMPGRFGPQETVPGGRGLKFRATVRLRTQYKGMLSEGTTDVGIDSWVKVVKNKIGPFKAEFPLPIRFDSGVDDDMAMYMHLQEKLAGKCPVWQAKGEVFVKLEDGTEVSAPLRGRGLTVLLNNHKGTRSKLRNAVMATIAE